MQKATITTESFYTQLYDRLERIINQASVEKTDAQFKLDQDFEWNMSNEIENKYKAILRFSFYRQLSNKIVERHISDSKNITKATDVAKKNALVNILQLELNRLEHIILNTTSPLTISTNAMSTLQGFWGNEVTREARLLLKGLIEEMKEKI